MLEAVHVGRHTVDSYAASASPDIVEQLRALSQPLRGLRVLHLNATSYGGGVAEILRSEIPLLRDLGLDADWKIITADDEFFTVSKEIHNGLQGAERELTSHEMDTYLAYSTRNAQLLQNDYDLVVVHDPQPLAVLKLDGRGGAKWVWRCHIETSNPNEQIWGFLRPFVSEYDAAIFTLSGYVPPDFPVAAVEIIPPAIDPENPKNIGLHDRTTRRVISWIGIDLRRPLITQVSRFDPWKDPLGVIAAYRLVKKEVPDLQLALVGSMASDDPEGWDIYRQIEDAATGDQDIYVFTNLTGVGPIEVNAFQRLSDAVIQKSTREGFGLTVSEALWKGTPVVAGNVGGIPLQLPEGVGGFLVDSIEECAERCLWLLKNPDQAKELGKNGREHVREHFLLTRLIADELRLYDSVVGAAVRR